MPLTSPAGFLRRGFAPSLVTTAMSRLALFFFALAGGCIATTFAAPAQDAWGAAESFVPARQRLLHSASTGRDYRILVSVPDTPPPAAGFPILYVLDGHAAFPLAAFINQEWSGPGPALGIRPGIVVGIVHLKTDADKNPRADDFTPPSPDLADTGEASALPQGGADRFLDFIETELKPVLAADFKIDPARQTLFGHSYGGLFTLHVLFTRPASFQRYVAASPSIWWNRRRILAEQEVWLQTFAPDAAAPRLLITVGDGEQTPLQHHYQANRAATLIARRQVDNARELAAVLSTAGLPVTFRLYPDENHGSARVPAINHAVRVAFGD